MGLKPPNLVTMVMNFSKALKGHAKDGFKHVAPTEYMTRVNECMKCPKRLENTLRCGLCGCNMEFKATWRTSKCADKDDRKWEAIGNN